MTNQNEENKDGLSPPVNVTDSGMHVVLPSTGQVADNPFVPDKLGKPSATYQNLVVSPDNKYLIDAHTGDVAENPLAINDPVKRDNVAVMQRVTSIWLAHLIVLVVLMFVGYGQLACTPPRDFTPPIELWGIVLGIYGASSTNFLTKLAAVRAAIKGKK